MRISAQGAVIAGAWVPGDVELRGGRLVRAGLPSTGTAIVLPALVDLHVCGYAGVDFNTANSDDIERALNALARDGVLAVQPTLITDSEENIVRQLRLFAAAMAANTSSCRIVGVHAEGPFLSSFHRGVHHLEHLRNPDIGLVERFLEAGPITTITVAPELDGAIPFIEWAAARGINVHAGHTGVDAQGAHAAFDAGVRGVTHLFNGMISFGHREPGIAGVALAREDVAVQVIADDVHLAPEASIMALRATEHRAMLVTDSTSAAGGATGEVTIAGLTVTVKNGVPRLADGTLAGSTVTLLEQVRKLVSRGWSVDRAVNLASRAPARYFGLPGLGELVLGGSADLIVASSDLVLERVLANGEDVVS